VVIQLVNSGLLVVAVVLVMVLHQILVVVEVLQMQLLLHMQVQALVHILQIQETLEKMLLQIVDQEEVVVDHLDRKE
tara:strand:+ start:530 stop:760 length:231 start_codon:yes stop_codon:yes gene_type:complete